MLSVMIWMGNRADEAYARLRAGEEGGGTKQLDRAPRVLRRRRRHGV